MIGQSRRRSHRLAARLQLPQPAAAAAALREVIAAWDRQLSAVKVKTPDPRFNVLVNRWLLYQVLACRLWGRSAFYQSGGRTVSAINFRTLWRYSTRNPAKRAPTSSALPRGSSSKATFSTGGTRLQAAEFAHGSRTTSCGCLTPSPVT